MVRNIKKRTSHEKKGYAKAYPFFRDLVGSRTPIERTGIFYSIH